MFNEIEVSNIIDNNRWKLIKTITTGWTNFVKEVEIDNNVYIARFPKTEFFAKYIKNDVISANFIRNNLKIPTSEMLLKEWNGKYYSLHKKIIGYSLEEMLPLNEKEQIKASIKIAEYFYKLHTCPIDKIPQELKSLSQYDILRNLPKLPTNYDYSIFREMIKDKETEKQVLINGDITEKNIIVGENNEIIAFIDFAFCSMGDIYTDLAVIGCLSISDDFFNNILVEYEKLNRIKLNRDKIKNRMEMRKYINKKYIEYMKTIEQ